jgi:hypothetical protein
MGAVEAGRNAAWRSDAPDAHGLISYAIHPELAEARRGRSHEGEGQS